MSNIPCKLLIDSAILKASSTVNGGLGSSLGGDEITGGGGGGGKTELVARHTSDLATGGVGGDTTGSRALSGFFGPRRLKQQYIYLFSL